MNDWEAYSDDSKIDAITKINTSDFLLSHEFGQEIQRGTTDEKQECRNQEYMDRLVDVIPECLLTWCFRVSPRHVCLLFRPPFRGR